MSTYGEVTAMTPAVIIRGPDDNLWFSQAPSGSARINLAGTIDQIADVEALDLTVGLDGGIWFTEPTANKIGRVSALAFHFINLTGGAAPLALAHGPDDSVWFADAGGNRGELIAAVNHALLGCS